MTFWKNPFKTQTQTQSANQQKGPVNFDLEKLQKIIQYQWKDPYLLKQALCHKSYAKENPKQPHNEKLEFLGDAVLELVITDLLMKTFDKDNEGSLSRKRASIVNEERLCSLATEKSLDSFLLVGKNEIKNELQKNPRILASTFEAIVGAIYKDSDFERVHGWLHQIFKPVIDRAFSEYDFENDYKSRLQEWVQEKFRLTPVYHVISEEGPDHARVFEVEIIVGDQPWGKAKGHSKKSAAHNAARKALEQRKNR